MERYIMLNLKNFKTKIKSKLQSKPQTKSVKLSTGYLILSLVSLAGLLINTPAWSMANVTATIKSVKIVAKHPAGVKKLAKYGAVAGAGLAATATLATKIYLDLPETTKSTIKYQIAFSCIGLLKRRARVPDSYQKDTSFKLYATRKITPLVCNVKLMPNFSGIKSVAKVPISDKR